MSVLTKIFNIFKSNFIKRFDLINIKQNSGQSLAEFSALVNAKTEKACPPLKAEDLKCLLYVSGMDVSFQDIRTKLIQKMEWAEKENKDIKLIDLVEQTELFLAMQENAKHIAGNGRMRIEGFETKFKKKTFNKFNKFQKFNINLNFSDQNRYSKPMGPRGGNVKKDLRCFKCQRIGHISRNCDVKKVDITQKMNQMSIGSIDVVVNNTEIQTDKELDPWDAFCFLNGNKVKMMIDTGARATMITEAVWTRLGKPKLFPSGAQGVSFTKEIFKILGKCFINVKLRNKFCKNLSVYVIPNGLTDVMGRNWILKLGVIENWYAQMGNLESDSPAEMSDVVQLKTDNVQVVQVNLMPELSNPVIKPPLIFKNKTNSKIYKFYQNFVR